MKTGSTIYLVIHQLYISACSHKPYIQLQKWALSLGTEGESQGISSGDDATWSSQWKPRQASLVGRLSGLAPVYKVNVLFSHPPAYGPSTTAWDPTTSYYTARSTVYGDGAPPNTISWYHGTASVGCQLIQASLTHRQPTCGSSRDIFLLCRFTQVLKINLTLIALTGEKLIEVLFLIYEEP